MHHYGIIGFIMCMSCWFNPLMPSYASTLLLLSVVNARGIMVGHVNNDYYGHNFSHHKWEYSYRVYFFIACPVVGKVDKWSTVGLGYTPLDQCEKAGPLVGAGHQRICSNLAIEDDCQAVSLTGSSHQWGRVEVGQGAPPNALTWWEWRQRGRYMCAGLWAVTTTWETDLG